MQQDDILNKPLVAIVILCWNGKNFLEQFLPSVMSSTYQPLDIYIADNASTDDSIIFLEKKYPSINIIKLNYNEGFAKGYNIALSKIVADYFILLNQDVEVTETWIDPVIYLMEQDISIAACQPKVLSYLQKNKFEHAGAAGGYIDRYGYAFCKGRVFDTVEENTGQFEITEEIFWASGAALFVRADIFKRLKGFDGDFFAHMEEIDLCWRMKRAGYKIMYVAESAVYHVGGGSLPNENPRKIFLNYRNNLSMVFKNWELYELVWKLPMRLLMDSISFARLLFQKKWKHATAIWQADWYFIFSLPWQIKKRVEMKLILFRKQMGRSRAKEKGYYKKSIVWQYFVKKKKKFEDLF